MKQTSDEHKISVEINVGYLTSVGSKASTEYQTLEAIASLTESIIQGMCSMAGIQCPFSSLLELHLPSLEIGDGSSNVTINDVLKAIKSNPESVATALVEDVHQLKANGTMGSLGDYDKAIKQVKANPQAAADALVSLIQKSSVGMRFQEGTFQKLQSQTEATDALRAEGKMLEKEVKSSGDEARDNMKRSNELAQDEMKRDREGLKGDIKGEKRDVTKAMEDAEDSAVDTIENEADESANSLADEQKDQQKTVDGYNYKNREVDAELKALGDNTKTLIKDEKDIDKADLAVGKMQTLAEKTEDGVVNFLDTKITKQLDTGIGKSAQSVQANEMKDLQKVMKDGSKDLAVVEKAAAKAESNMEKNQEKTAYSIKKDYDRLSKDMDGLTEDTESVCLECGRDELDKISDSISGQAQQLLQAYMDGISLEDSSEQSDLKDVEDSTSTAIDQLGADTMAQTAAELDAVRKQALAKAEGPATSAQTTEQGANNAIAQGVQQVDHVSNSAKSANRGVEELDESTREVEMTASSAMADVESTAAQIQNSVDRARHEMQKMADKNGPKNAYGGSVLGDTAAEGGNIVLEATSKFNDELYQHANALDASVAKEQQTLTQQLQLLQRTAGQTSMQSGQYTSAVDSLVTAELPKLQRDAYQAELTAEKGIGSANATVAVTFRKLLQALSQQQSEFRKSVSSSVDGLSSEISPVLQSQSLEIVSALNAIKSLSVEIEDKDKLHNRDILDAIVQTGEGAEELRGQVEQNMQFPRDMEAAFDKAENEIGVGPLAQQQARLQEQLKAAERSVASYLETVSHGAEEAMRKRLAELGRSMDDQVGESSNSLEEYARMIAEKMEKSGQGIEDERLRIDGVKTATIQKCKEIEEMLKRLEADLHDSSNSLESSVDRDLLRTKKETSQLGEMTSTQLATISESLRAQLDHVVRVLEDESTTYDSSMVKQIDDAAFYLKHYRDQDSEKVAALLNLVGEKATQVEATDQSARTALANGQERWRASSEGLQQQGELLQRKDQSSQGAQQKLEAQASRQGVASDRMSAAGDTLGEQSQDISGKAADEVEIAGSSVTSQAKTGEAELSMTLSKIEAQEQKAFQEQNERDRMLAEAVGLDLSEMNDIQVQALRDYAASSAARAQISNLIKNEQESLNKNVGYLEHYNDKTAEQLLAMMGAVALQIEKAMGAMHKDKAELDAVQVGTETRLDDLLGSDAVQTLQKIASADDLAMKVEMEDEFLIEWAKDHQHEADIFKKKVEAAFAASDELMVLHAAEIKRDEDEAKARDAKLRDKMITGIGGMASQVNYGGVGGVEEGFTAGIHAFEDKTKTTNELDEMRLSSLQSVLTSLSDRFGLKLQDAKGAMNNLRTSGKTEARGVMALRDMLDNMVKFYDSEAAKQQAVLSSRQQKFQDDLLMAGVSVGGETPVTPPTAAETASLLAQAEALANTHASLETKHEQMGQTIGQLLGQLTTVVSKVHGDTQATSLLQQQSDNSTAAAYYGSSEDDDDVEVRGYAQPNPKEPTMRSI